jgi:hypothetical protein
MSRSISSKFESLEATHRLNVEPACEGSERSRLPGQLQALIALLSVKGSDQ